MFKVQSSRFKVQGSKFKVQSWSWKYTLRIARFPDGDSQRAGSRHDARIPEYCWFWNPLELRRSSRDCEETSLGECCCCRLGCRSPTCSRRSHHSVDSERTATAFQGLNGFPGINPPPFQGLRRATPKCSWEEKKQLLDFSLWISEKVMSQSVDIFLIVGPAVLESCLRFILFSF